MNSKDKELIRRAEYFISYAKENINDLNPIGDDVILELQKAVLIKYVLKVNNWPEIFNIRNFINIGRKATERRRSYGFKLNKLKRLLELEDNMKY